MVMHATCGFCKRRLIVNPKFPQLKDTVTKFPCAKCKKEKLTNEK